MAETRKPGEPAQQPGKSEPEENPPAAASEPEAEKEPTFTVEDLIGRSRVLFGVSPHIAAGALSKGNRRHYTESDAKQRVEEFANMELNV